MEPMQRLERVMQRHSIPENARDALRAVVSQIVASAESALEEDIRQQLQSLHRESEYDRSVFGDPC